MSFLKKKKKKRTGFGYWMIMAVSWFLNNTVTPFHNTVIMNGNLEKHGRKWWQSIMASTLHDHHMHFMQIMHKHERMTPMGWPIQIEIPRFSNEGTWWTGDILLAPYTKDLDLKSSYMQCCFACMLSQPLTSNNIKLGM